MLKKYITKIILLFLCKGTIAFATSDIQKLKIAYPNHIKEIAENKIIFHDNSALLFDDKKEKNFFKKLINPSLKDQMSIKYTSVLENENYIPKKNEDPGRIRNYQFFKKIYGATQKEIKQNLIKIKWMPQTINKTLYVTTVNNIHEKLKKVSNELDKLSPELKQFVNNPAGTYKHREIAGTNRLSMHSYGIAIDINVNKSHYWKWDKKKNKFKHKNLIPLKIVKIFEKEGFIWGGRWFHYDTMHFEYRPELLIN